MESVQPLPRCDALNPSLPSKRDSTFLDISPGVQMPSGILPQRGATSRQAEVPALEFDFRPTSRIPSRSSFDTRKMSGCGLRGCLKKVDSTRPNRFETSTCRFPDSSWFLKTTTRYSLRSFFSCATNSSDNSAVARSMPFIYAPKHAGWGKGISRYHGRESMVELSPRRSELGTDGFAGRSVILPAASTSTNELKGPTSLPFPGTRGHVLLLKFVDEASRVAGGNLQKTNGKPELKLQRQLRSARRLPIGTENMAPKIRQRDKQLLHGRRPSPLSGPH